MTERRFQQTVEGSRSDDVRLSLIVSCLSIGSEHPILGISPQKLPRELGRRLSEPLPLVDPHNVFGYIIAGSGFLTFSALMYLGWTLWRRPRGLPQAGRVNKAHSLLRMMVILWAVRGMFTREILYSPTFSVGIGLCIGLCLVEKAWQRRKIPARAMRLHETQRESQAVA